MIPAMSPPWWKVCGAQYTKLTLGESMPWMSSHRGQTVLDEVVGMRLEREVDALPLEDRQQLLHRSPELRLGDAAARSGRPLSSEFMTVTPSSTAISMERLQ